MFGEIEVCFICTSNVKSCCSMCMHDSDLYFGNLGKYCFPHKAKNYFQVIYYISHLDHQCFCHFEPWQLHVKSPLHKEVKQVWNNIPQYLNKAAILYKDETLEESNTKCSIFSTTVFLSHRYNRDGGPTCIWLGDRQESSSQVSLP